MADDNLISIFEISGNEIVGGDSDEHNQRFFSHINSMEEHALNIGRSLGMNEVSLGVFHHEYETVGFRFAESSGERFDIKGAEINAAVTSREALERLR